MKLFLVFQIIYSSHEIISDIIRCCKEASADINYKIYDKLIIVNIVINERDENLTIKTYDKHYNIKTRRYIIKRLFEENIDLNLYDSSPDKILECINDLLIKYNLRNAILIYNIIYKEHMTRDIRYLIFAMKQKLFKISDENFVQNVNICKHEVYTYNSRPSKNNGIVDILETVKDNRIEYRIVEIPEITFLHFTKKIFWNKINRRLYFSDSFKDILCEAMHFIHLQSLSHSIDMRYLDYSGTMKLRKYFNRNLIIKEIKKYLNCDSKICAYYNNKNVISINKLEELLIDFKNKKEIEDIHAIFYSQIEEYKYNYISSHIQDLVRIFIDIFCYEYYNIGLKIRGSFIFLLSVPNEVYNSIVSKVLENHNSIIFKIFVELMYSVGVIRQNEYVILTHFNIHNLNENNQSLVTRLIWENTIKWIKAYKFDIKSIICRPFSKDQVKLIWFFYMILSDIIVGDHDIKDKFKWFEKEFEIRNSGLDWFKVIESPTIDPYMYSISRTQIYGDLEISNYLVKSQRTRNKLYISRIGQKMADSWFLYPLYNHSNGHSSLIHEIISYLNKINRGCENSENHFRLHFNSPKFAVRNIWSELQHYNRIS